MAKTEQLIEEQSTAWDILSTPFRTPAEIEWQDAWNAADAGARRAPLVARTNAAK